MGSFIFNKITVKFIVSMYSYNFKLLKYSHTLLCHKCMMKQSLYLCLYRLIISVSEFCTS